MKSELLVPRLNTNDDEVDVVHWYVKDRDYVEKGKEIVDLESSKAVVSIETETSGYVLCHPQKGDTVAVGASLATFYSQLEELEADLRGSNGTQPPSLENEVVQQSPQQIPLEPVLSQQLAGLGATTASSQPLKPAEPVVAKHQPQATFNFTRFSKAAQDYLERNQISPTLFEGMGLVSVEVIETVLGIRQVNISSPESVSSQPQSKNGKPLDHQTATHPELRSEKVSKSKQLEISLLTAGQAGGINSSLTVQFNSVGIRQTLEELGSLNGQMLPLILFELARLLEEYPAFTAYYNAGQIYYYDRINLGLAIDLGKGLKVPIIRHANQLSPSEILETITDFATRYLDNQLSVEELTGGTITISDLSSENVLHFQPLINQNQSVILGIGGDKTIEGYPMTLTLVFDHRVLAGRDVALFLNLLKDRLLSYQLTNLPLTEIAVRAKNITCNRCLIDLESLYQKFGRDALMHVHVDDQGQTAYICHVCLGGF